MIGVSVKMQDIAFLVQVLIQGFGKVLARCWQLLLNTKLITGANSADCRILSASVGVYRLSRIIPELPNKRG
jgi:hypothetical protein